MPQNHAKTQRCKPLKESKMSASEGHRGPCMRNRQTPSGFVPKGLRNASQKNCRTSPLESIKKQLKNPATAQETRLLYSQVHSSGIATKPTRNLALETRFRKPLKHQQDSCQKACETPARKTAERHLPKGSSIEKIQSDD